ncbi:MAG: DEAD/DEAH box helicase family protein, partial [Bacteroidales bacterium]|nr:DEAD/DEAH box helicase family protein [Bacteroidales bacterium]
ISPKDGSGISHTKTGCFSDGLNFVGFDGSCNFSRTALVENIESLTVSCDWDGEIEKAKIQEIRKDFERVFQGKDDTVNYVEAEHIKTNITKSFKAKNLGELLDDGLKIIDKDSTSERMPKTIVNALKNAKNKILSVIEKLKRTVPETASADLVPRFPYPTGPREYQIKAFENWKDNKQKGLFAMATGTGKTITSLNCLLEIYKRRGYYKAIILVPTITLVEQWEKECNKFNFNNITKICSKYSDWKSTVSTLRILESTDKENNFIIITTYASFVRSNVFTEINSFSAKKLLLIADEAHNIGGGKMLARLADIKYLRRIGLSATPERQYDDTGNRRIMEFFGCADSYTFEYSMREAIENGALCRYYYYPHIVKLTEDEMLEYVEISKKIVRIMNYQDDKSREILKILLLNRKRIVHKAENKKEVFASIVESEFAKRGNLKYTLVYVPEGNKADDDESDIFENSDIVTDDDFSVHLIDEFTKIVRNTDPHIIVRQFTAESDERDEILKSFADGSTDVLTSMKCLDEGVDVPRSELAVFCASTGNPRQFIQRRGRILRTHKDKKFATIHDLVVVPDGDLPEECFSLEKSLVEGEIKRVRDFALLSENCHETLHELDEILTRYNISIFN